MLKAKMILAALALAASQGVMAELVQSGVNSKLYYRLIGQIVCFDTKINVDDQIVDASIYARLQDVRGDQVQLQVTDIKVSSLNIAPPKVLVVDTVSYTRGDSVWAANRGWYVCP